MTLQLDHLHIKNYRCFEELHIPQFKQINLIAGKNNVGKTALLEAVRILASEGNDPYLLSNIIENRNEFDTKNRFNGFESLFNILSDVIDHTKLQQQQIVASLQIGELTIFLDNSFLWEVGTIMSFKGSMPKYFKFQKGIVSTERIQYVPSNILHDNLYLWEEIDLTPKKKYIIDALNLILNTDNIKNIGIYETAKVLLKGTSTPIPLKRLGDGMNRMLTIALALVSTQNSILLIDEFENGLHYTVQEKLWEFIFQMAKKLNVQVFVTTHSRDCIEAFGDVARKEENQDVGQYMRLDKDKSGKIKAVIYEQDELITAVDENIETR